MADAERRGPADTRGVSVTLTLVFLVATLWMVAAGTAKKRLEWRPRPVRERRRRRQPSS